MMSKITWFKKEWKPMYLLTQSVIISPWDPAMKKSSFMISLHLKCIARLLCKKCGTILSNNSQWSFLYHRVVLLVSINNSSSQWLLPHCQELCNMSITVFVVVTKYPDINNLISRYISKYRRFPDYQDIRDIIIRCNHRHSLKIKSASLLVMLVYEAATRRINCVVI